MENEKNIQNLFLNDYPNAVRSGQVDNYLKLFNDNVKWIPDGGPDCNSKEEMRNFLTPFFGAFKIDPVVEIEEINFNNGSNSAYVIAKSHASLTPHDGSEGSKPIFRVLWYVVNGPEGWKISRQIWNTTPAS